MSLKEDDSSIGVLHEKVFDSHAFVGGMSKTSRVYFLFLLFINMSNLSFFSKSCHSSFRRRICLLENYQYHETSGNVPFFVLDGYFAKEGYEIGQQDDVLQAIRDSLAGRKISVKLTNIYYFQEGKTYQ